MFIMDSITNYIKRGEKGIQTGQIGLEVEHFILHKETGVPMPYEMIAQLFEQLAPFYRSSVYEQGNRIALENHWVLITLEPGCQLELSFRCTKDLCKIYDKYMEAIGPIRSFVEKEGYQIVYSGGLPTVSADQVKRIDKERYHFMEEYFRTSGTRGLEMMKATAAVHVSIDYADESDFIKKIRLANILHPLFMFLTFNTPVYAGKKNEDVLLRDSIWHGTDEKRCQPVPSLFEEDFGYQAYADYIWNTPMILMQDEDQFISVGNKTGKELAIQYGTSDAAIAHYMSMVFPDIRIKQFIEIRSGDSMPIEATLAYCALIKGIFYQPKLLDSYQGLAHSLDQIQQAKQAIRQDGWNAIIYGQPLDELAKTLIEQASKVLTPSEKKCLSLLKTMVDTHSHIGEIHE